MSQTYIPTQEDKALIKQAKEAFNLDPSYLEQILWEARKRKTVKK